MVPNATLIGEAFSEIVADGKLYLKERLELELLKGADKASKFCAMLITLALAAGLAAIVLLFILAGLAVLINLWLHSAFWGFFIVALLVIIGIVLLFTAGKRKIRLLILDYIIGNMEADE